MPEFRLVLNDGEAYAEVKPVTEFPMDVAQRVVNAGRDADVLILGRGPRHAWRYRGDGGAPAEPAPYVLGDRRLLQSEAETVG